MPLEVWGGGRSAFFIDRMAFYGTMLFGQIRISMFYMAMVQICREDKQIIETYELRSEIEEDFRQMKDEVSDVST